MVSWETVGFVFLSISITVFIFWDAILVEVKLQLPKKDGVNGFAATWLCRQIWL